MTIRKILKGLLGAAGYTAVKLPKADSTYDRDGLVTVHDHDFLDDPNFQRAYARGVKAAGDYGWHWRVHIGLWAASTAARLNGDFVECGVNRGFLSSSIMEHLDWDATGKTFYLLDTFAGIDEKYVSGSKASETIELNKKHIDKGFYVQGVESVRANFAEWNNVRIIQGSIPETLSHVDTNAISYLHLDMNNAAPEVAAFDHFWGRLVTGAVVLLDDYAYAGYSSQKHAMDETAAAKGAAIASLPTGQGLIVKTP